MPKKKTNVRRGRKTGNLGARLDEIIRLLEDLFTLQAANSRVATGKIQGILGIRKARISKIVKGVKQARKLGKEEA
jgi:hypothetical protein